MTWSEGAKTLQAFGGAARVLNIRKTGLPFFDALRLYGAIDLYIGLREDITVHDRGDAWQVSGRCRTKRIALRDNRALRAVYAGNKPTSEEFGPLLLDHLS